MTITLPLWVAVVLAVVFACLLAYVVLWIVPDGTRPRTEAQWWGVRSPRRTRDGN